MMNASKTLVAVAQAGILCLAVSTVPATGPADPQLFQLADGNGNGNGNVGTGNGNGNSGSGNGNGNVGNGRGNGNSGSGQGNGGGTSGDHPVGGAAAAATSDVTGDFGRGVTGGNGAGRWQSHHRQPRHWRGDTP